MKLRVVVLSLLVLSGCGASAPNSRAGTTPAASASSHDESERPVTGEHCFAAYLSEHDVTLITIELPSGGIAVAPAVGDHWEIDCRPRGNQLVLAHHGNENLSVVIDGLAELPADLEAYAREHAATTRSSMEANGVQGARVADPLMVSSKVYALVTSGTMNQTAFAQISVYSLASSSLGVLRYHGSIIGPTAESVASRSYEYAQAAERFGYLTPEQVREVTSR